MTQYVDCMVVPIKSDIKAAYLERARVEGEAFKRHGALKTIELWGDDIPEGKNTSLPLAVKLKADETVVVGWIIWPDKATRDKGMETIVSDPLFADDQEVLFDGSRLIYGGFELLLET
ncbi:MAG: DUF1428 domain-containing protein [Pseudomonadota bacterium]